ncbi:hypothetical protein DYU05_02610 [Mucilaginibacter terrenus]|uniref:Uncharacterized protein n=1 Tax=Mucilaginibacter terrenus TaxID=2482727 RepID=A0A3E2NU83_9SPHI|nr:hypothetical protein [Mucilaginibacter terrenus]RFZ84529.1 hypothetical protein DYU05_02610 [Mucilaginibacter terrenus]
MGIFNFLKRREPEIDIPQIISLNSTKDQEHADIPENVFIQSDAVGLTEKEEGNIVDNNINLLFSFLDRNHESKGYNDALINPDVNHLNQNLDAIKNELLRVVNKVKTFYEDFIREINYHIDSRSRSGMVDTVEELLMKKGIAESHIKKVLEIEADAQNGTGDSQGVLISYTRGFKNGLAAISHHSILNRKF